MNARDDYPELVRMLAAMDRTDEPDWLAVRTEIDRLRAIVQLMIEQHGTPTSDSRDEYVLNREGERIWIPSFR